MSNTKVTAEEKSMGPITSKEIQKQRTGWVKRFQARNEATKSFRDDQPRLNHQTNNNGIYECQGRLQGYYPIYLPDQERFTEKLVMDADIRTLHGGVSITFTGRQVDKIKYKAWWHLVGSGCGLFGAG